MSWATSMAAKAGMRVEVLAVLPADAGEQAKETEYVDRVDPAWRIRDQRDEPVGDLLDEVRDRAYHAQPVCGSW